MDEIVITRENLEVIVKNVIESTHESLINIMTDKLENEGSNSVIQFLLYLQKTCQDGGYGRNLDEFIEKIVNNCFEQYETTNSN